MTSGHRRGGFGRRRGWALGVVVALSAVFVPIVVPVASAHAAADEWWFTTLQVHDAWKYSKGAGVTVAVVDSGVQASLGDLRGRVLPGKDFTGASPDGRVELPNGKDFGHGSYMASLIAGTGDGAGIVGLAPAAKILPVRVALQDADASSSTVAQGIRWAVDHGASIVNVSLSDYSPPCDPSVQQAVSYALAHNVLVAAATGDDDVQAIGSPAVCSGALAVGAVDSGFVPWSSETYGAALNFVEPGVGMANSTLGGVIDGASSGTSSSTAILSGVLALLRSRFPHDTARQIVTRLLWTLHSGRGTAGVGKRINDHLGYGEPLPYFGLTVNPPKSAPNPIFDRIDAYQAAHPSASPTSAGPPSPSDPVTAASPRTHHASSSSNSTTIAVVSVVVVVLLIAAGLVIVAVRRRA
jgi:membrane-anchored mycosin MYCP